MLEEAAPACLVLFGAFANAKNLSISFTVHPDRHQQRHVANLAGPAALEHNAVQIDVGVLPPDRPVAPSFDGPVDLLVQVRHRRRDTRVPYKASVMSSTRRTETPARYISIKASSTELSRRR
jgi:hypothetical protein